MDSTSAQPAAASPAWFDDNRRNWDDRAVLHAASGYGIQALIDDPQAVPDTLAPDLPCLGDLTGASLIHLQCHLGTDTIGLKRQGAGRVVGVDLSGESLRRARQLAAECNADIEYVESNVYDARAVVDGEFDVVFSTLGVLCWLPDVTAWAQVVGSLLVPGGRFLIRDDHPFFMTIGEDVSDGLRVEQTYFQQVQPMTWESDGSYVDAAGAEPIQNTRNHQWNHSLAETITALLQAGLVIDTVEESPYAAWCPWPELMVKDEHGYRLRDNPERLPLQFRITAHKP